MSIYKKWFGNRIASKEICRRFIAQVYNLMCFSLTINQLFSNFHRDLLPSIFAKIYTMIQRIQSLYLVGAVIALLSMFYLTIATFSSTNQVIEFDLCYIKDPIAGGGIFGGANPIPQGLFVQVSPYVVLGLVVILLLAIFMYKNRKRQIMLANIAFIINLGFLAFVLMTPDKIVESLPEGVWETSYKIGYVLPIISIGLIILATKAIKKDDALVRAADRLR